MNTFTGYCITMIVLLFSLISFGQTITTSSKELGTITKPGKLKDTTVYQIITQTKDTFYFGSDKKMKISDPKVVASNIIKVNSKSLEILFNRSGALLMTLNLEITKQRSDTIAVLSIFDPTMIVRFRIEKIYNCEIKSIKINNYEIVLQSAYHRQLLSRLFNYKNNN